MIYQSSQAFSLSDGIYPFINSYKAISDLIYGAIMKIAMLIHILVA